MRRLVSTVLLASVLVGAAACGTKTAETPGATPSSQSSTPTRLASPTPAGAVDRSAACAAIKTDMDAITTEGAVVLGSLFKAQSDPSLAPKAIEDVKAMFAKMQANLEKDQAAAASDPEVKATVATFIETIKARRAAIEAAGKDLAKVQAALDDPAFEAAGDKLSELCGAGK